MINKKHKKMLGYLAGSLTSFAFIPQVLKVHRTDSTDGLSLKTLIIFFLGQIGWMLYGYVKGAKPTMIFSILTAVLYAYLIKEKIRHKKEGKK